MKKALKILILLALPLSLFAIGTTQTSASASTATCFDFNQGDLTTSLDWQNGKASVTNHTSNCTYKVGLAAYKAYQPYPTHYPSCSPTECPEKFNWIWTQTYFDSNVKYVAPGQTVKLSVRLPSCAYQVDVYAGSTKRIFKPGRTYSEQGKYIDGWYNTYLPMCKESPTPTPTKVVTPTPTKKPTPTPTPTCTPTPSYEGHKNSY